MKIVSDSTRQFLAAAERRVENILDVIGTIVEGTAVNICPYDTGYLKGSLTHDVDGLSVFIGSNVEYAPWVELGTSRMGARPYLVPAVEMNKPLIKRLFRETS